MVLTAFYPTFVVTRSEFPPVEKLKNWLAERTGEESGWSKLVDCSYCFGLYVVTAFFLTDHYLWTIPILFLQMGAAMSLVGYLGVYAKRP